MKPIHWIAEQFRSLTTVEKAELRKDISEHGLREPGVLFEGKVLDGRHRQEVCEALGIEMEWVEFQGAEQEAFEYVFGRALSGRHLTENERINMAIDRERIRTEKWGPKNETPVNRDPINCPRDSNVANALAKELQVSPETIYRAQALDKGGIPELKAMSNAGKIGFKAAAIVASLPKREQRRVVAGGSRAIKEATKPDWAQRDYSDVYSSAKPTTASPVVNGVNQAKAVDVPETILERIEAIYARHEEAWKDWQVLGPSPREVVDVIKKEMV